MAPSVRHRPYDVGGPVPVLVAGPVAGDVHVVGDRGAVRVLAAWCTSNGLPADAIVALDNDEARVDPATAARLLAQLRDAGAALRERQPRAVAWLGDSGLAGGVICSDGLGDVACWGDWSVRASTEPVALVAGPTEVLIAAWTTAGDALGLDGPIPVPQEVHAALTSLTGGAGRVVAVPATSVVAGLLTTAAEVAERCARAGAVLRVGTAARED